MAPEKFAAKVEAYCEKHPGFDVEAFRKWFFAHPSKLQAKLARRGIFELAIMMEVSKDTSPRRKGRSAPNREKTKHQLALEAYTRLDHRRYQGRDNTSKDTTDERQRIVNAHAAQWMKGIGDEASASEAT